MTTRRTDDEIRAALQPFLQEARAGLELQVEERPPQTDLQESVERAHRQDPDAVPDTIVEATRDPALLPSAHEWTAAEESPQLGVFVSDVAEHIESWVEARRLVPIPALVLPASSSRLESGSGRRSVLVAAAVFAVAAAAVLLLVFVTDVTGLRPDEARPRTEAVMSSVPVGDSVESVKQGRSRAEQRSPTPKPETVETVETPVAVDPSADSAQPVTDTRKPRAAAPKPVSLAELDRRAQALWGKGEVREAQVLLEEIVRRGGKSKYAELAFGDLFTMAHSDRGSRGQSRLWRRYLARFPKGKYADDARASLCRAASGSECWDAYLRDWPRGAHRSEAKRRGSGD